MTNDTTPEPTIVLDPATRAILKAAVDHGEVAANAAKRAANTLHGFYVVLLAYLIITGIAGVIVGVAWWKAEDELGAVTPATSVAESTDEPLSAYDECMDDDNRTLDECEALQ